MLDFLVPASIDSPSGFDVRVEVRASSPVWPDAESVCDVALFVEKREERCRSRVPRNEAAVMRAIEELARDLEVQLSRERARRNRAAGLRPH